MFAEWDRSIGCELRKSKKTALQITGFFKKKFLKVQLGKCQKRRDKTYNGKKLLGILFEFVVFPPEIFLSHSILPYILTELLIDP